MSEFGSPEKRRPNRTEMRAEAKAAHAETMERNKTTVRVIGADGELSDPFDVQIVAMQMNDGRPEITYQKVGGTMTDYKAEWRNHNGVEGWIAYPMD